MNNNNKIRLLLSAYQCGVGMGSVSQIGWEWYSRLSEYCHVTLLTHSRNRPALAAAGAPLADSEIIYIDSEWFAGPLYRFAGWCFPRSEHPKFLIASLDFFVYDWLAVRQMRQRLKAGQAFDIVHAVTPVSPLAATRLYKLGLPLVLGPWNGGLASPNTFPEIMQAESKWLYSLRNLGRVFDRLVGSTRHAALIFTATQATFAAIPVQYQSKCRYLLENGVNLDLFPPAPYPPTASASNPLQVVFTGRLLPFKGVPMLLEAVKALVFPVQLTIVGEGSERGRLEQMTAELGLSDTVRFTGNLPLAEVAQIMQQAHVFCLPSVRESGGAVLLEAMAVARPVIAVDFGGPSEIVDAAVGVKLPATGKAAVVEGLIATLTDVYERPQHWQALGAEGRRRVEDNFSWAAKIAAAIGFYRQLLEVRQ